MARTETSHRGSSKIGLRVPGKAAPSGSQARPGSTGKDTQRIACVTKTLEGKKPATVAFRWHNPCTAAGMETKEQLLKDAVRARRLADCASENLAVELIEIAEMLEKRAHKP